MMSAIVWLLGVGYMCAGLYTIMRGEPVIGVFLMFMGVLLGPGGARLFQ